MVTVDLIEWGGVGISLLYRYIRQYHLFGHFKFSLLMCQTVSPFNTYTSTRSTLTLFSSHSRSTLQLYTNLQRFNTFSIKNNSFEQVKYFIHEHDQIENPILRNNLRVHRYHAHLEQPHITFSLDHNFYNKHPRTLILTV